MSWAALQQGETTFKTKKKKKNPNQAKGSIQRRLLRNTFVFLPAHFVPQIWLREAHELVVIAMTECVLAIKKYSVSSMLSPKNKPTMTAFFNHSDTNQRNTAVGICFQKDVRMQTAIQKLNRFLWMTVKVEINNDKTVRKLIFLLFSCVKWL